MKNLNVVVRNDNEDSIPYRNNFALGMTNSREKTKINFLQNEKRDRKESFFKKTIKVVGYGRAEN